MLEKNKQKKTTLNVCVLKQNIWNKVFRIHRVTGPITINRISWMRSYQQNKPFGINTSVFIVKSLMFMNFTCPGFNQFYPRNNFWKTRVINHYITDLPLYIMKKPINTISNATCNEAILIIDMLVRSYKYWIKLILSCYHKIDNCLM